MTRILIPQGLLGNSDVSSPSVVGNKMIEMIFRETRQNFCSEKENFIVLENRNEHGGATLDFIGNPVDVNLGKLVFHFVICCSSDMMSRQIMFQLGSIFAFSGS